MYDKVVIKRKNKLTTLASIISSFKLPEKNRRVAVDPLTISQRVCIAEQSEQCSQDNFKYDEQGMRKGTESTLYSAFQPHAYLLHKVVWQRKSTVQALSARYTTYVRNHFEKNVSIIFDGYHEDAAKKTRKQPNDSGATQLIRVTNYSSMNPH
ncbi:unnamed protein product [Phaedon cochleariae]|uniref:Transposase n=1 Tax=Phaedon cochleariae TaxID=80249 RepID=A0A9N9SIW7_PHACE|nr:unnamed protein product [Phaedon cochleariae]